MWTFYYTIKWFDRVISDSYLEGRVCNELPQRNMYRADRGYISVEKTKPVDIGNQKIAVLKTESNWRTSAVLVDHPMLC